MCCKLVYYYKLFLGQLSPIASVHAIKAGDNLKNVISRLHAAKIIASLRSDQNNELPRVHKVIACKD